MKFEFSCEHGAEKMAAAGLNLPARTEVPAQKIKTKMVKSLSIFAPSKIKRDVSSVGSEHCLDKAGVTGSSPVHPTELIRNYKLGIRNFLLTINN